MSGTRIGTLPNALALSRVVATPIVIGLLLLPFPGAGMLAFGVFAAASVTDYLDGRIARARGQVNTLGVFLDLTADKVLQAGVLVAMVEVGLLPTWIVALIIVRELVVAGARQLAAAGQLVIAARTLGKAKTVTTQVGMGFLLLAFDAASGGPLAGRGLDQQLLAAGYWVMVAAAAIAVVSGLQYLAAAWPVLRGEERPPTT